MPILAAHTPTTSVWCFAPRGERRKPLTDDKGPRSKWSMRDYGETSYIDQSIGGLTAVESRWPGQGVLTDFNVLLY